MTAEPNELQKSETIKEALQSWFATTEGSEALLEVLSRIGKMTETLECERTIDAQAVERPVTL